MDARFAMPAKLFAAVVSVIALGACTPSDEGTQPRPDVVTFEQGDFEDLPLLAGSEALAPTNEEDGVVVRSYGVPNTTAEDVLAFYQEQLADEEVLEAPSSIGENTFRGRWQLSDGRVLIVSATRSPAASGSADLPDEELVTQFSLSLSPAEG
jgi:hypothetical protein